MTSKLICGEGGHYSIYRSIDGMGLLRSIFPDGEADEMNFCLFSTSGVHGTYRTIEEEEEEQLIGITFLIVQPRVVAMHYGEVYPASPEDFEFLKKLRRSSKEAVSRIG